MASINPAIKVIACFATTLDGKIAPADTAQYVRLGTDEDILHLQRLRDEVDAVLFGAETFRAYPRPHKGTIPNRLPLHCIVTRSCNLLPESTYFKNQPFPKTMVFSPKLPDTLVLSEYPILSEQFQWLAYNQEQPAGSILACLVRQGVQSVLLEGGGQVFSMFLREQLVDELHLTLCPWLLGGESAPGLLSGEGFSTPTVLQGLRTELLGVKRLENEVYLKYKIIY